MKADSSHIKQIKVVSNTHWDREFRRSFEKTRRRLLTMLDITLGILDSDPAYHSFTMDGHSIMIDDYLEMRPDKRALVQKLVRNGRLIIGPYYTLAEEFSIGHEPLVRNLMMGRKTVEKYGGKCGTVAYTPSSWGQTGQLPQILADFGLNKMMFYRGISHHEADAEWIWQAPDGTRVLASRFAVYARYNWYYQVHRAVTQNRVFEKDFIWGVRDEVPMRIADGLAGEDLAFDLQSPEAVYDKTKLRHAIEDMVKREGPHFTTEVFLAMNGHDISVAHPLESRIIRDAKQLLGKRYKIEHTDLEGFWTEAEKHLDKDKLPVLVGERRSYLKKGMWTFLFPGTVSARTYLKQSDFKATNALVYNAEPFASLANWLGLPYPTLYMERAWRCLLSNHTHDANGGCAPDAVCQDMEYRYRNVCDIADIVTEDTMSHIAKNLSPKGVPADAMQLVVYNPLPIGRDVVALVDLEMPSEFKARAARLECLADPMVSRQPISDEKSSSFVDSIWEVPRILDSNRVKFYAQLSRLPALGYRTYRVIPERQALRPSKPMLTGRNSMENEFLRVRINLNGTATVTDKSTRRTYENLNYLRDDGECGNAWKHVSLRFDRTFDSLGVKASVKVLENGPLVTVLAADYKFPVPSDYADGTRRSKQLVELPVHVEYRLEKGARRLGITLTVDNIARDHWLRASFPTGLQTDVSCTDSHYDVVTRPIAIPDSTGWVEPAFGTHPLRTFVSLSDGTRGVALFPRGLYEYEVFDDSTRTLALTLIRACRIKLAVSEEKQTELPDAGIQCPGIRRFEYAVHFHSGDWKSACLLNAAAEAAIPVRAALTGRGKGKLPHESSLMVFDNPSIHVTCVKQAEDGRGLIVRCFNPLDAAQDVVFTFGGRITKAHRCRMDESVIGGIKTNGTRLSQTIEPRKIRTIRVVLA
jgi:alpha-mannosidase